MSATSSSLDPVQTVIDLLSGTAETDYPNGKKPSTIAKKWEAWQQSKQINQDDVAAYVHSPDRGEREALSAAYATADQREMVEVEIWARTQIDSPEAVHEVAEDCLAVLEDFANDRQDNTEWHRIRPRLNAYDDRRQETTTHRKAQSVYAIRVELRREDSIGT